MGVTPCEWCGQVMTPGVSCTIERVSIGGHVHERRRYVNASRPDHCRDCATPLGGMHHPGCDRDPCPACGGQFLFCGEGEASDARCLVPNARPALMT